MRPRSATRNRDVVKKKVGLLIGYDGANYYGLQRNAGVETISDAIERALHVAGAISDENFGHLEKIKWQVAARTDRGVSAAGNIISAKLLLQKDEVGSGTALTRTTARINEALPDGIRLFGIKYATSGFSARGNCGERWYEYMLPMSSLQGDGTLESFRGILKQFEGPHFFHNYTVGPNHVVPPVQQASRYVTLATCDPDPVYLNDDLGSDPHTNGWIRIRIRGQSFMLHQIRKMMSLALLIYNGKVPGDAIQRSFCRMTHINVPPAPAEGLYLDSCHFHWYNKRQATALPEPISLSEYDSVREKFKHDYILPSLAKRLAATDALVNYENTVSAHPVKFP